MLAVDIPLLPVLGAVASGMDLRGERFRFDVIGHAGDCARNFVGGFEVNADPVGNGETRIPAHVLDAVHELTRQAFVDELRRELRIRATVSPSADSTSHPSILWAAIATSSRTMVVGVAFTSVENVPV